MLANSVFDVIKIVIFLEYSISIIRQGTRVSAVQPFAVRLLKDITAFPVPLLAYFRIMSLSFSNAKSGRYHG